MRGLIRVVALCGVVFIYMLCLVGCLESTNSRPHLASVVNDPDLEFQMQADRPPTAKTLYAMADILATQGRDSECEFVLKRIVQEYPPFLPAYNKLAELQMRQRRVADAIETISNGLRIHSRDPVLLNNLGMCWLVHRDYERALESFTEAAGIMPENARYRANMAMALGLMGRDEESMSLFRQVLPEDQANENLALLREARKNVK